MSESCCNIPQVEKQPAVEEKNQQSTIYMQISGMGCNSCVNRVYNSVLSTYGVTSVIIELADGLAEVKYNPALTSSDGLVKAVSAAGNDGRHNYMARVIPIA